MRIVLFGDSLTWGGYGGSYAAELARLMPEHTFINAGEGGNTVINLLRRFERDVLSEKPDAVFIMVGGNDAISFHQPATRSYYTRVQKIDDGMVTPDQFETAYRDLLTQCHLAHLLTWVGLEPLEYSPMLVDAMRDYNARAASAARALNIPTLDLLEAMLNADALRDRDPITVDFILTIGQREKQGWTDYDRVRLRDGFTYTFDGVHVTPAGAISMAHLIADFINQHLR